MSTTEQGREAGQNSKFGGALPFILIFGGLTAFLIIVKLLMNLLMN